MQRPYLFRENHTCNEVAAKGIKIKTVRWTSHYSVAAFFVVLLAVLYMVSLRNYLLAHTLIELYAVIISFTIFYLAWNSRKYSDNNYLLLLGIAYLFVGGLDLLHTISYRGMGVFTGSDANLPTQLWIAARYVESISVLIAPAFIVRRLRAGFAFTGYVVVTLVLLLSIFYWKIFPDCYVAGSGLTSFKVISEYIISALLIVGGWRLYLNRVNMDRSVFKLLIAAIILTIASEMAFTLYTDVYGLTNFIGHAFKLVSFYLLYRAIIVSGLQNPYSLLFKNMQDSKIALQKSQQRLKHIFDSASDAIVVTDKAGKIIDFNKSAGTLIGHCGRKGLMGKSVGSLFSVERRKEAMKALRKIAGGKKGGYTTTHLIRADGSEFDAELRAGILTGAAGEAVGLVIIVSDITERLMLEEARRDMERKTHIENRLATVGRLAAGMAHEINNPLTSVIGHAQLLLQQGIPGHIGEDVQAINEGAQRVANIVGKLQVFAREQNDGRMRVDVNDLLEHTLDLLDYRLKARGIAVTTDLAAARPAVFAAKAELQQAFLNILLNAEQAMFADHKRGNLHISTEVVGDEVRSSFQDSGPGIAPDDIEHIFDPFFTTRSVGQGTGLGLSISREIVLELGGEISVQSELGRGTTLHVKLPLAVIPGDDEGYRTQDASRSSS